MCGVKMPNIVETVSIEVKYTKPDYEPAPEERSIYLQFTLWYDYHMSWSQRIKRFLRRNT